MKILFVCHGSTVSGMGHMLRTNHVAQVCAQYTETKVAILGMHTLYANLDKESVQTHFINTDEELVALAVQWQPDCICFDLLSIDDGTFRALTTGRLSASISPVFSHLDKVDLLFHRTERQPDFWKNFSRTQIYSGLEYAVIDKRVTRIPTAYYKELLRKSALSVGVSMGGTDAPNKTFSLLESFRELPVPMVFWVLLGEGYAHSYEDLVNVLVGSQHEILLIKSNRSMWQILQQCALVFLAGGVTSFEAAYAGLPSVNLLENETHAFLLEELACKGALKFVTGNMKELCRKSLLELSELDANREKLLHMHQSANHSGVNTNGAERIVKTLFYHLLEHEKQ